MLKNQEDIQKMLRFFFKQCTLVKTIEKGEKIAEQGKNDFVPGVFHRVERLTQKTFLSGLRKKFHYNHIVK